MRTAYIIGVLVAGVTLFWHCTTATPVMAQEVGKGQIPPDQLETSVKHLPWGVPIWDEAEAVDALVKGTKALWVDTRPESFFKSGTVRGAVLLTYNQAGKPDNILTADSLDKALRDNGLGTDAMVIFFCQGPECHRSYNASYVAVNDWNYKPEQVVWFRAGYPLLLAAIKNDAKLKRKAKLLISDEGMNAL